MLPDRVLQPLSLLHLTLCCPFLPFHRTHDVAQPYSSLRTTLGRSQMPGLVPGRPGSVPCHMACIGAVRLHMLGDLALVTQSQHPCDSCVVGDLGTDFLNTWLGTPDPAKTVHFSVRNHTRKKQDQIWNKMLMTLERKATSAPIVGVMVSIPSSLLLNCLGENPVCVVSFHDS